MSREIRPKSFGTFEKQAPVLQQETREGAKFNDFTDLSKIITLTSLVLFAFAGSKLLLDFFLDDDGFDLHAMYDSQKKGTQASSPETPSEGDVAKTFEVLAGTCSKELVDSVKGVFEFHLEGKEPGVWYLDLKNDSGEEISLLDTFHFSPL